MAENLGKMRRDSREGGREGVTVGGFEGKIRGAGDELTGSDTGQEGYTTGK